MTQADVRLGLFGLSDSLRPKTRSTKVPSLVESWLLLAYTSTVLGFNRAQHLTRPNISDK